MADFKNVYNIDEFKKAIRAMNAFGNKLEDLDPLSKQSYSTELMQNAWFHDQRNILEALEFFVSEEIDISTDIIEYAISQIHPYIIERNLDIFIQGLCFDQALARFCHKVSPIKIFEAYEGKVDFAEEFTKVNPLNSEQILLYTPFTKRDMTADEATEFVRMLSKAGVNFATPNPNGRNQIQEIWDITESEEVLELMAKTTPMSDLLSVIGELEYIPDICKIYDEMGKFDLAILKEYLEHSFQLCKGDIALCLKDLTIYRIDVNQLLAKPDIWVPSEPVLSRALYQDSCGRTPKETIEILTEAGADFSILGQYEYAYAYADKTYYYPLHFRVSVLSGILRYKGPDQETVGKLSTILEQYDLGSDIQVSGSLVASLLPYRGEDSTIGQIAQKVIDSIEDLSLTDEQGVSLAKHIIEHTNPEFMDQAVLFCLNQAVLYYLTEGTDCPSDILKSDGSNADLVARTMVNYEHEIAKILGSLVASLLPYRGEDSTIGWIAKEVIDPIEDLSLTDEQGVSLAKRIIEHTNPEFMDKAVLYCLTQGVHSIWDILKSDGSNADLVAKTMMSYEQFGYVYEIIQMYELDEASLLEDLLVYSTPQEKSERQQYEKLASKLIYSLEGLENILTYLEMAMQLHNVTIVKHICDLLEGANLSEEFAYSLHDAVVKMPNFIDSNIVKSMVEHLLNPDLPLPLEAPYQLLAIEWHGDEA